jgi:hypothetical protein
MRKFLATTLLLVLAATLTACPPTAVEKPVIKTFTVDKATLPAGGGNITLSWTTTGASEVNLSAVPATPAPVLGADKVTAVVTGVTVDTTFTLTAKNSAGDTVTATKKVTISAPLPTTPTITKFNVKTATIAEAKTITLPAGGGPVTFVSAVTAGPGSAIASLSIDNGVGAVTPLTGGNTTFTTATGGTYTLTATSAAGTTDTDTVTVNIAAALAPTLVSSVPDNAATGVALNNNTIVVNFNKAMNKALTEGAFSGVTALGFVWSNGDTTATITFTAPAAPAPTATGASNTITYNFSNAAKSADGGTLAAVSRTYTTLKLVKATLTPVATLDPATTLSGSVIYTDGTQPAPTGQPATCGTGALPVCAQNDIDPSEYRIGDSSGIVGGTKVANPNNAYKAFVGFNLAPFAAITPANLVSATFSMNQNAAPQTKGTPYALGTMKLQSISSAALSNAFLGSSSFFFYTAPTNSSVDFSSAGAGLKTATVTTQLSADLDPANRTIRGNRALFRLMFPKVPAVTGTFDGATNADGLEDIADFKNTPSTDAPTLEIVYTQP